MVDMVVMEGMVGVAAAGVADETTKGGAFRWRNWIRL